MTPFQKARGFWLRLLKKQPSKPKVVRIVDFIRTGWGHAIHIDPQADHAVNHWECHGWCHGIAVGDVVVTSGAKKISIFYWVVKEIRYCRDPSDMFFGSLEMLKEEPHPSRRQQNEADKNSEAGNRIGSRIEIKTREEWEADLGQEEKTTTG